MAEIRPINLAVKIELNTEMADKLVAIAKTAKLLSEQIESFSGEYEVKVVRG